MADYQPLIAKAVAGLEKSTGEARRSLYERARPARRSPEGRRPPDERLSLSNEGLKGSRDVVAEAESLGDATAQAGKNARAAYAAVPSPSPEFDRLEPRMESDALRARDRRGP